MSSYPEKDGGVLNLEKGVRLAHVLSRFSTELLPRVKALLVGLAMAKNENQRETNPESFLMLPERARSPIACRSRPLTESTATALGENCPFASSRRPPHRGRS
jgi:hypothetical protein